MSENRTIASASVDPDSLRIARELAEQDRQPAPILFMDTLRTQGRAAVEEAISSGAVGEIGVRSAALRILFPDTAWPPAPNPPEWKRSVWWDKALSDYISSVAPPDPSVPLSLLRED